ncbi:hypothetical protein COV81_02680 [Candidatus Peregrinibacteria bacterium CG11_big_fil_rev_8_21_14_0_20_41_10]|nr:MAG: hypothetical protein COV81_02680 [Candidatus Peregrinibacteria bacterium CG11_big_fil_rev_8_21_14_0_20_41_10]PIZ76561.1 MAG: hypothetical protein COY06_01685 [Candidatus Peregrinibacteria bacterium CG_4_10_14_0_2_um_filter_41_8]PJC37647.1 MAG: hypothetical protein CO045_04095 [Candidatus Peregrinibacteria bacterium CG_4_9_14_0_2_um_filter_41_14]
MNLRKRRSLSLEVESAVKYLHFGLLTIIVGASLVFLYNFSQASVKGYEVSKQEVDIEQAEDLNHKLKMQTLEAQSYEKIEASLIFKNMVTPDNANYIESRLNRLTRK